jgi:hypothetical protein
MMKPFSKFEAIGEGKPVVTRDGRKVTQLKEFEVIGPYQLVGVVEGKNSTTAWTDDGKYYAIHEEHALDLFMASAVKEGWVAFGAEESQVSHGMVAFVTHAWPTEIEAVCSYRIANESREPKGTAKISWEE